MSKIIKKSAWGTQEPSWAHPCTKWPPNWCQNGFPGPPKCSKNRVPKRLKINECVCTPSWNSWYLISVIQCKWFNLPENNERLYRSKAVDPAKPATCQSRLQSCTKQIVNDFDDWLPICQMFREPPQEGGKLLRWGPSKSQKSHQICNMAPSNTLSRALLAAFISERVFKSSPKTSRT